MSRNMLMVLLTAGCLAGSVSCSANEACFAEAASTHDVPAEVLQAIAQVESKNDPGAVNHNRNGTVDLGLMQINSSWLPKLKARFGVTKAKLLDACTNIHIGAWILSSNLTRYRELWRAVGAYHSPTPRRREAYARKVFAVLAAQAAGVE